MFYCDLSCLVLAADRQLWKSYGSALLDQLEANEGCLLPVENYFLRVVWEGN